LEEKVDSTCLVYRVTGSRQKLYLHKAAPEGVCSAHLFAYRVEAFFWLLGVVHLKRRIVGAGYFFKNTNNPKCQSSR